MSVSWDVVSERNELLEISAVPVPMDPDALMERNLRGLHTITDMLTNLIDEPDEPKGDEAEAVWQGTALQMVRLFTASADDGDFDQRAYKRLCRQYQRLGKEAPEIPDSLDALDLPTIRGLFLAGEPELVPELFVVSVDTERQAAEALSRIQTMLTGVKV